MHLRGALRALSLAVIFPLTVVLAGELPAAHGTEIDGACGDRPCDEAVPADGACGDRPCDESVPADGACGDRPCDEIAAGDGPCGDRPCEDPAAGATTMDGAPQPAPEPGAGDDGAPAGQITPGTDDAVDPRIDEAGDLETASEDSGSFPTIPVVVGLAAVLLGVLALVKAKRRRG